MLFKEVKKPFIKEPILRIYIPSLLIKVKIDILDFILKVVEQLGILYRKKEKPYSLVTISGELVLYKDSIINLEIELIQIDIKR